MTDLSGRWAGSNFYPVDAEFNPRDEQVKRGDKPDSRRSAPPPGIEVVIITVAAVIALFFFGDGGGQGFDPIRR